MASKNETVDDIVKEMRARIDAGDGVFYHIEGKRGLQIADRIVAAHQREVAELEAKLSNTETARKFFARRINSAKKQVAELRECVSDMRSWFRLYFSCSGYPNRAQCTGCRFGQCPYHRWRKALEGGAK